MRAYQSKIVYSALRKRNVNFSCAARGLKQAKSGKNLKCTPSTSKTHLNDKIIVDLIEVLLRDEQVQERHNLSHRHVSGGGVHRVAAPHKVKSGTWQPPLHERHYSLIGVVLIQGLENHKIRARV